jgi:hypothetical protein
MEELRKKTRDLEEGRRWPPFSPAAALGFEKEGGGAGGMRTR